MDISISIVNWNTKDLLRNCLRSIYANTHRIKYEIFVIDNASSDGSCQMIEREFPKVKLIKNKENFGFARANNQAIKESRGRYVLLLNPDTLLINAAFEKMVRFMDSRQDIGISGCKIIDVDGKPQFSCGAFPDLWTLFYEFAFLDRLFPGSRVFGKYKLSYWDHNDAREVDHVTGACLMVRRQAIKEIGLLDKKLFIYFEDVDWCYRMKKAGWKTYFLSDIKIIHYGKQSSFQNYYPMLLESYKSRAYLFKKHYNIWVLLGLRLLTISYHLIKTGILGIGYISFAKKRNEIRNKLKLCIKIMAISYEDI